MQIDQQLYSLKFEPLEITFHFLCRFLWFLICKFFSRSEQLQQQFTQCSNCFNQLILSFFPFGPELVQSAHMMAHSNPYNLVYIYIITQDFEDSFELAQVELFKSKGIPQYKSQRGCFFLLKYIYLYNWQVSSGNHFLWFFIICKIFFVSDLQVHMQ